MKVLVLSDTHMPHRMKSLPPGVYGALEQADAILHAGDFTSVEILEELGLFAPLHAVAGNSDPYEIWNRLPRRLVAELGGYRIGLIHGDGAPRHAVHDHAFASFKGVDCVVFGHTHKPFAEWRKASGGRQKTLLFNPGSVGEPRYGSSASYGWLRLGESPEFPIEFEHVPVRLSSP